MKLSHTLALFCSAALTSLSCDRATPTTTTRRGPLSHRVVHLATGDSVEWQQTLPALVDDYPPGVLVEFYPFTTTADTAILRGKARALLPLVVPEVEARQPAFIVLRAVDLPAAKRVGIYRLMNLGTVFEKRGDGHWYESDSPTPAF
jgi:hypothetical protein